MAEINPTLPDLQRKEQIHDFALSWVSLLSQPRGHPSQVNHFLEHREELCGASAPPHSFNSSLVPAASVWCGASPQPGTPTSLLGTMS